MSFPAALFELRLGLRQQGRRCAPVFYGTAESRALTQSLIANPVRERLGLFARLRLVAELALVHTSRLALRLFGID
jgi:hypothetical protein